jgi:hypothetical protein
VLLAAVSLAVSMGILISHLLGAFAALTTRSCTLHPGAIHCAGNSVAILNSFFFHISMSRVDLESVAKP